MKTILTAAMIAMMIVPVAAQVPVTPAPAAVVNPNAEVTNKAVDLTAEQDAAIYRDATMTPAERAQIPVRLGDNVPLTVKTAPVPESLGIEKAKGLWYTVVPNIRDGWTYHDVILIDGSHKVVRIIQKPRAVGPRAAD